MLPETNGTSISRPATTHPGIINMRRIVLFCLTLCLSGISLTALRADIIAQANFQTGTVEDWFQPWDSSAVTVQANAGPAGAGDFAIRSLPQPGVQFMFPQNTLTAGFVGNYLTSGAASVQFDYRGNGTLASGIELYVVMLNGNFNRWVSLGSVVPTANWQTATISVLEADLVHPLGSNSYATDFANIDRFGFRFQADANQSGGSAVGSTTYTLDLDNIRLLTIPEPGSCLAGMALLAMATSWRRRQRG
jgi:hypothetical protein